MGQKGDFAKEYANAHVSIDISDIRSDLKKKTDDPYYKNFVFEDVDSLVEQVMEYHESRLGKDVERIIEGRKQIAKCSLGYLDRIGPDLPKDKESKIREMIELMGNSDQETIILMSAHQPNLFAYSGILRKIALLDALGKKITKRSHGSKKVICFYAFADHDFINNKWVKSAEMCAPLRKGGLLRFNVDFSEEEMFLPSNRIKKPSKEKLDSWKGQINSWMRENSSLASRYIKLNNGHGNLLDMMERNFNEFWDYVEISHKRANNLAEFSSFTLSLPLINALDTPVVFANFSDCFQTFQNEYRWLIDNMDKYSSIIEKNEAVLKSKGIDSGLAPDISEAIPIWIKCKCGSKYKLLKSQANIFGRCLRCSDELHYTKEQLISLLDSSAHLFEPRAISMPLTFSRAIDMSCYVGGIGGMGYLMHSRAINEALGLPFPPTPYWNVPDRYIGIETLASAWETTRIASSFGIDHINISPESVADATSRVHDELKCKIDEGSIKKGPESERGRRILETIPPSLATPSCAIDYAINIGMKETYSQWIKFLTNGGELQEPVKLRSVFEQI